MHDRTSLLRGVRHEHLLVPGPGEVHLYQRKDLGQRGHLGPDGPRNLQEANDLALAPHPAVDLGQDRQARAEEEEHPTGLAHQ